MSDEVSKALEELVSAACALRHAARQQDQGREVADEEAQGLCTALEQAVDAYEAVATECDCDGCGKTFHVATSIIHGTDEAFADAALKCPHCGSDEFGWQDNTGDGEPS